MESSSDAQGAAVSDESIYRWIYALPKGELARQRSVVAQQGNYPQPPSPGRRADLGSDRRRWSRSMTDPSTSPIGKFRADEKVI